MSEEVLVGGWDEGGGYWPACFPDRFFCSTGNWGFFFIYIPKLTANQLNCTARAENPTNRFEGKHDLQRFGAIRASRNRPSDP